MTLEESQKIIKEYLESNQNIINESELKRLKEVLEVISGDLKSLSENGTYENNSLLFQDILEVVVSVSHKVLISPLNNLFSAFLYAFSELVFNWNNNTYKNENVLVLTKFTINTIISRDDMLVATKTLHNSWEKIMVTRGWSPPSFDMAIAYVDEQLKINEEQKGVV